MQNNTLKEISSRQARYEPAYAILSARRRTTSGGRWSATTGAERRHRIFEPIFARDWGNKRRPSRQARYEPAYVISSARRRTTSGGRWSATTGAERRHRTFEPCQGSKKKRPIGVPPISLFFQSARRESNPRPPPWQGGAPPLSHSRIVLCKIALTRTFSIILYVLVKVNTKFKIFYIF